MGGGQQSNETGAFLQGGRATGLEEGTWVPMFATRSRTWFPLGCASIPSCPLDMLVLLVSQPGHLRGAQDKTSTISSSLVATMSSKSGEAERYF